MSLRCPHGGFISQCRECYEDRVEVRTMRAVERIEDMLTKPYPEGDVMDALAAERKRIRAAVEGCKVSPRWKRDDNDWQKGYRDGWNDALAAVLAAIDGGEPPLGGIEQFQDEDR